MKFEKTVVSWGQHRLTTWKPGIDNVAAYLENRADGLRLGRGVGVAELAPAGGLAAFPDLKLLVLDKGSRLSEEELYGIDTLEELSLTDHPRSVDLAAMPGLRRLAIGWRSGVVRGYDGSGLQVLRVWGFKSASGDLTDFPKFADLRQLEFVDARIRSACGISEFSGLEILEIIGSKALVSLGEMSLQRLKTFSVDECPALGDVTGLGSCHSLEVVRLHGCRQIPSVDFVRSLPKLQSFRFVGTTIVDGNLEPLVGIPDVYFSDRPHYSRKCKEFRQDP